MKTMLVLVGKKEKERNISGQNPFAGKSNDAVDLKRRSLAFKVKLRKALNFFFFLWFLDVSSIPNVEQNFNLGGTEAFMWFSFDF